MLGWSVSEFLLLLCVCVAVEESAGGPGADALMSPEFLADILERYNQPALRPAGEGAGSKGFSIKLLNIVDPLLPTNNLGRSVARANFLRIRRAFAYGASRLEALLLAKVSAYTCCNCLVNCSRSFMTMTWEDGLQRP